MQLVNQEVKKKRKQRGGLTPNEQDDAVHGSPGLMFAPAQSKHFIFVL